MNDKSKFSKINLTLQYKKYDRITFFSLYFIRFETEKKMYNIHAIQKYFFIIYVFVYIRIA